VGVKKKGNSWNVVLGVENGRIGNGG